MDIGTIDHWANNRDSSVHRASALSKLIAAGLVIAAVIASDDLVLLLVIYLVLAAVIVITGLPARQILLLGAYPAVFALLFAISRWNGDPIGGAVIVVKAVDAALAMLLVITTTPYPAIFAVLYRVLPARVGDALFITYRALFVLLALMGELWTALRLRGGFRSGQYGRNVANLAAGLGLLLVRAIDLSEELYQIMRVRGYRGRIAGSRVWQGISRHDVLPLAVGAALLSLTLAWRLRPDVVADYNGYVLLASLVTLLLAVAVTYWPSWTSLGGDTWRR